MFTLEFTDYVNGVTKVTSYDEFYDGFDVMVHQWDELVNMSVVEEDGYATVLDYGLDEKFYPCGCYEYDGKSGYGILTRLGSRVADYTWTLKEE